MSFNPTIAVPFKKNRLVHWRRYWGFVKRYGSAKKFANLATLLYHYQRGTERLPTFPAFLKVEVCRYCDVNCRYCEKTKDRRNFPLQKFKDLIDELKDYLFVASLYDIGEPLHNPELLEYVHYAHCHSVGTVVSTSLSIEKPERYWRDLVGSGLDRLVVAIDGITKPVYTRYRTNGDFGLVMDNLKTILALRPTLTTQLQVEWQMIDLPWNKHEQQAARALAKSMGVDAFSLKPEENTIRLGYEKLGVIRHRNCLLPYIIYIVDAYNRVRPCYKLYTNDVFVGDLSSADFASTWNSEEMFRIRNGKKICRRSPCMTCLE